MNIVWGILGVIALVLLIAAFLPKRMEIWTETTISAPKEKVRDFVKMIKNQEQYSVRVMADPDIKLTYSGTDGEVGFISAWTSEMKNVGVGAQEIIEIDPGKKYVAELRFEKPMKATNYAETILEEVSENESKVISHFRGDTKRPGNLFSYAFKPALKKQMSENLENLKKILEK